MPFLIQRIDSIYGTRRDVENRIKVQRYVALFAAVRSTAGIGWRVLTVAEAGNVVSSIEDPLEANLGLWIYVLPFRSRSSWRFFLLTH
jgi:hypothetical protein